MISPVLALARTIGLALAFPATSVAAPPPPADTLRGVVADSAGRPVAGAAVRLEELSRVTQTGPDGRFLFADVPPGRFTVVVRRLGYAPVAEEVEFLAPATLHFALRPSPFLLEPVTVTATRTAVNPLGSPLPEASLSEDRLRRTYTVSIAHALDQLAGVRTLSTGGEIGKPVIRGLAGARVLVLDRGHRLEDYSWSDEDGPSVDARFAERLEVIRGPASVLYGSDAVGGVVNVIPADVPDGPRPARVGVEAYGASNNAELGSAVRVAGAGRTVGWRLGLVGRKSEALHTPAGELENTGFAAVNGEGALGAHGSWGKGTLRLVHYGGEFHLLEADEALNPQPRPPGAVEEEGPVRKLADDRAQLSGVFPLDAGLRLDVRGQYQRHWLAEVVEGDTGSPERGFDLLLNTLSLDFLLQHGGAAGLTGTVGVSGLGQHNATRGEDPLVPAASVTSGGLFAFEQLRRGRWTMLAGGRVDLRHLATDGDLRLALGARTRDYTAGTGDVGLVYRPVATLALAANLGRAWRAPTLFELFANGLQIGEARYNLGDPGLEPEASLNLDASLRFEGQRVRGELSGYRNLIGQFIYLSPTGQVRDSFPLYRYRQADALLVGGETSVETQLWRPITVSARASYVRGSRRDTGEPLPAIPPWRTVLGAEWRASPWPWSERVFARGEVELVARQHRLSPFDIGTAGYRLVHLALGVDARVGPQVLAIDLTVRNLANTAYRDFLSRYKAFALSPGRNVVLRVATEF